MAQDNQVRVQEIQQNWKKFSLGLFLILEKHFKDNHYFLPAENIITSNDTDKPYQLASKILGQLGKKLNSINSFNSLGSGICKVTVPPWALPCQDIFFSYFNENIEFIDRACNDVAQRKNHVKIIDDICESLSRWDLKFLDYDGKKSDQKIAQDSVHPANTPISSYQLVQRTVQTTTTVRTTIEMGLAQTENGSIIPVDITISATQTASKSIVINDYQKTDAPPVRLYGSSVNQTQFAPARETASGAGVNLPEQQPKSEASIFQSM